MDLSNLYEAICNSWTKIPVPLQVVDEEKQNAARLLNAKNLKHQTDLKLRKEMSRWMQALKQSSDLNKDIAISTVSKQINKMRKDTLGEVGKCVIDDEQELLMMMENFVQQFNDMVSTYCATINLRFK